MPASCTGRLAVLKQQLPDTRINSSRLSCESNAPRLSLQVQGSLLELSVRERPSLVPSMSVFLPDYASRQHVIARLLEKFTRNRAKGGVGMASTYEYAGRGTIDILRQDHQIPLSKQVLGARMLGSE